MEDILSQMPEETPTAPAEGGDAPAEEGTTPATPQEDAPAETPAEGGEETPMVPKAPAEGGDAPAESGDGASSM